MTPKEFQALTANIIQNLGNQALVSELLTKANEAYETTSTTADTFKSQLGESTDKIKSLQETNMNLYLKVGNPVPDEKLSTPEPLKYEDLLSDMGVK